MAGLEQAVYDIIQEIVSDNVTVWSNVDGDSLTVRDLKDMIDADMEDETFHKQMEEACAGVICEWKQALSSAMEKAVNAQVSRLYAESVARNLLIPGDIWNELQAGSIDLSRFDLNSLLDRVDISGAIDKVVKAVIVIAATAIGSFAGPMGTFIGAMVGKIMADITQNSDLDKPRPWKARRQIAAKYEKTMTEEREKLFADFRKSFDTYRNSFPGQAAYTLMNSFEVVTLKRFGE